jgi:hypothetical protein
LEKWWRVGETCISSCDIFSPLGLNVCTFLIYERIIVIIIIIIPPPLPLSFPSRVIIF